MAGKKKYREPLSTKVSYHWTMFKTNRGAATQHRRYKKYVKGGRKGEFKGWPKHWWWPF